MDKNLLRSLCLLFVWAFLSCTLPAQQEGTQNRLQLAGRYMQAGEPGKALSLYAELYEEDPQIFVYEAYVDCLQSLGRYDQAEKIIRKQMRDGIQPLLYQVDLARNFLLSGQEKKAQAVFDGMLADWDMFGLSAVPVDELVKNIVEKTRKIQEDHIQNLRRDDGSTKNITLIDKKNIHNNRLQVINQYVVSTKDGAKHDNRYDVTVLVNGFPLVHIELKRRGVAIREAFNQIER